jgi:hypothetical protein
MRLLLTALAFAGLVAPGAGAQAAAVTPPGCHWVPTAERADVVGLWCRGPDGRARPTGQTLAQPAMEAWDGCPAGLMYDGRRCATEAQALAAADSAPVLRRSDFAVPPPRSAARVLLLQDGRRGRATRGLACTDQGEVTICSRIPHY